jgi:uncharacterized protein YcbX
MCVMSNSPSSDIGSVLSLWRYPIKSMQGEELHATSVTDGGLLGDRVYAVMDQATGKVASAKYPRKWGTLIGCHASFMRPPRLGVRFPTVRITMPDGTIVTSAQEHVHTLLSRLFERDVALTTTRPESPSVEAERLDTLDPAGAIGDVGKFMMPGKFSDYAAVHVLTTSTLGRLRALYPPGGLRRATVPS